MTGFDMKYIPKLKTRKLVFYQLVLFVIFRKFPF